MQLDELLQWMGRQDFRKVKIISDNWRARARVLQSNLIVAAIWQEKVYFETNRVS